MHTILLVEDEPAALRYVRTLIDRNFPDFEVSATAPDGVRALSALENGEYDLVITDVRMPVMDGIELVNRMKTAAPGTPVLIVSGYDDFEYVRNALNTGVIDYVLKPVTTGKLQEAFEKIIPALRLNTLLRARAELRALLDAQSSGSGAAPVSGREYLLAVLRRGGPMSRVSARRIGDETDARDGPVFAFAGRDGFETVFVANAAEVSTSVFAERCQAEAECPPETYTTLVFSGPAVSADRLEKARVALSLALDRSIVFGKNRMLTAPVERQEAAEVDVADLERIEHEVINADRKTLMQVVAGLVDGWKRRELPALAVQENARKVLEVVRSASVVPGTQIEFDIELEQLIARSADYDEFCTGYCDLTASVAGLVATVDARRNAASLFDLVCAYVDANFARKVTVESVAERFHVSASYLTRLFRTECRIPFNEYLRRYRIDVAKRLMHESPDMPLKNVARYAGFNDPFYFSRVFRAITGEAPSGFLARHRENGTAV